MVYLRSNTKNLNQIINFEKSLNICNIICLYNTFKTLYIYIYIYIYILVVVKFKRKLNHKKEAEESGQQSKNLDSSNGKLKNIRNLERSK